MPWLIVFVSSWILFFVFVDRKRLFFTLYGGLIFAILGAMVDWGGQRIGLYVFETPLVPFMGNSLFYILGPVFTMGVLFFQFLQRDRLMQVANILAFSLTYLSVEYLIVLSGAASYKHWHYLASFAVDLLAFSAMSYVGEIIIDRLEQKGNMSR